MSTWTSDEISMIGEAQELQIAPLRQDGTMRKPVTIWIVSVGNDLYVRSYRGRRGAWYRAAQASHTDRSRAGGVEKDVTFLAESYSDLNDQIYAAYRSK